MNQLSAPPENMVLLVERGPVANNWISRVPLLSSVFSSDGTRSQKSVSEYQPNLGRSMELVHGSALGGASHVDWVLCARSFPGEHDDWAEGGCTGWAWKDVEPIFIKSARSLDAVAFVLMDRMVILSSTWTFKGEWTNRTDSLYFPGFEQ